MPYRTSAYRKDFEKRVKELLAQAYKAELRSKSVSHQHKDMIFQCAVFQTSAALETYNRLIIEGWIQRLRTKTLLNVPVEARAFLLVERLKVMFEKFSFYKDEGWAVSEIAKPHWPWGLITGTGAFPPSLNGEALHKHTSYPSEKNLDRLYGRVGLPKIVAQISGQLKRDASTMIESFQSVRTALAHSSPPAISIYDVKRILTDMQSLVSAIDRILFKHVQAHGGSDCWT